VKGKRGAIETDLNEILEASLIQPPAEAVK